MKKIITAFAAAAITFSLAIAPALAAGTDSPGIEQRQINQQKRIDQGVQSGQLTEKEAKKLDKQQARIDKKKAKMKEDGKLTKKERAKLKKDQDKASKKIYKEKHDNQTTAPAVR
jgi:Skp family chaperone for outer membrane proteins